MFSEQDVDRELKAALSVSPSAEFEARVLRQVEADRPSRSVATYGWLAAAASMLVAVGLFYALDRTPMVHVPTTPQVIERATSTPPTTAPAPPNRVETAIPRPEPRIRPSADAVVARARTPQHQARAAQPEVAQPEVIVAPQQLAAVRRLIREVSVGRSVPEPVQETAAGEPSAVVVVPLAIEPLTVPTLEASGGVPSVPKGLQ